MAGEGLAARARALGMPGEEVDGNDVLAVYEAARKAVERARRGGGPATIVCNTFRYGGHHVGDPGTAYRSAEEVEAWKRRDPITRFERVLLERGAVSPDDLESIQEAVANHIQECIEAGRAAPFPNVLEVAEHVYA